MSMKNLEHQRAVLKELQKKVDEKNNYEFVNKRIDKLDKKLDVIIDLFRNLNESSKVVENVIYRELEKPEKINSVNLELEVDEFIPTVDTSNLEINKKEESSKISNFDVNSNLEVLNEIKPETTEVKPSKKSRGKPMKRG